MGLASASEMHRVVACPGYLTLKKITGVDERERESSGAAKFGTQIHASLAGEEVDLTTYQSKTKISCNKIRERLCDELLGPEVLHSIVETRFKLRNSAGAPIFSAKPDYVGCNEKGQWLLAEYKTLPGAVADAPDNWQLLSQAVCVLDDEEVRSVANGIGITEIYAAIIQPSVTDKPVVTKYSLQLLEGARLMIEQKLEHSLIPGAPRVPGAHCLNCPCSSDCMEGQSMAAVIAKRKLDVSQLSGDQLAELLPIVPAVRGICDKIIERCKEMISENPKAIPGYALVDWPGDRMITDLKKARDIVSPYITPAEFSSMLDIGVGKLEAAFIEKCHVKDQVTKLTAGKKFDELMKPVIERAKAQKRIVKQKDNV